jgi:Putative zinc-finger
MKMDRNEQAAIVEMTCVDVRALSVDYFDGDLRLDGYIRVDAHLHQCPHCSAIYNGLRNVVELLACDELFPMPEGLDKRIYKAVIGSRDTRSS